MFCQVDLGAFVESVAGVLFAASWASFGGFRCGALMSTLLRWNAFLAEFAFEVDFDLAAWGDRHLVLSKWVSSMLK